MVKLTSLGESFRIDIPSNAPTTQEKLLDNVAELAGDYGYPEELKLAHIRCVFSSLEHIELQAATIALHGLTMKEQLRKKIFPL